VAADQEARQAEDRRRRYRPLRLPADEPDRRRADEHGARPRAGDPRRAGTAASGRSTGKTRDYWWRRARRAATRGRSTARGRCARCGRPRSRWPARGYLKRTGGRARPASRKPAGSWPGHATRWRGGAGPRHRRLRGRRTYCRQRQQFGKPLVSFQIVQDRLVKMLAEVCSMQLYCLRLVWLIE
jgi:Acyl-CoA dehydrogenase, C-terminal domain